MKPAIIHMKDGKIIQAQHVRIVANEYGKPVLLAGIGPGSYRQLSNGPASGRWSKSHFKKMRDFFTPGKYIPTCDQDELGWCEPEVGEDYVMYDAHRDYELYRKFERIYYIRPHNIQQIEWAH